MLRRTWRRLKHSRKERRSRKALWREAVAPQEDEQALVGLTGGEGEDEDEDRYHQEETAEEEEGEEEGSGIEEVKWCEDAEACEVEEEHEEALGSVVRSRCSTHEAPSGSVCTGETIA